MNDAASTLYTLLTAETGAGEALSVLDGKLFRDENDLARSRTVSQDMPVAWLRVGAAAPLDNMQGSRWQVLRGTIVISVVAAADANADNGWVSARQSCETLCAAFERVLMGLRYETSATNPLGAWHDLTFASGGEGEVEGGPTNFAGMQAWGKEIVVTLTLRRYRAA